MLFASFLHRVARKAQKKHEAQSLVGQKYQKLSVGLKRKWMLVMVLIHNLLDF